MIDLGPVSAEFLKSLGYTTEAEYRAAQAAAQAASIAELEASLGPTAMGATPGSTPCTADSGGGGTVTIASGTVTLPTSAVSSATCGSATTVPATGVLSTDNVLADFNSDPTSTTGYQPGAMLTIIKYPTSGNVNFKLCNNSGVTITPAAVTLNWRVLR
jgi:hypothetical protein